MIILSDTQMDNIKHALGLNASKRPYRNYYNSHDNRSWNILCDLNIARRYPVKGYVGEFMYVITDIGIELIQKNPNKFNLDKRYTKMKVHEFRKRFEI